MSNELKDRIIDEEELKIAIGSLKMERYKGSDNICKECNKKGWFGSIIKYICESDNEYILCGWCGKITKVAKEFHDNLIPKEKEILTTYDIRNNYGTYKNSAEFLNKEWIPKEQCKTHSEIREIILKIVNGYRDYHHVQAYFEKELLKQLGVE